MYYTVLWFNLFYHKLITSNLSEKFWRKLQIDIQKEKTIMTTFLFFKIWFLYHLFLIIYYYLIYLFVYLFFYHAEYSFMAGKMYFKAGEFYLNSSLAGGKKWISINLNVLITYLYCIMISYNNFCHLKLLTCLLSVYI